MQCSEQADVDGNGTLDYGEFVAVSIHLKKMGNDDHLRKAFLYFDKNQSGYIEIEELRNSLADDLGSDQDEVIDAIIRDVDTDKVRSTPFNQNMQRQSTCAYYIYNIFLFIYKNPLLQDGRISYDEFAAMMKAGTDWRKASRQYSRERFNNLSLELMKDGSLQAQLTTEVR